MIEVENKLVQITSGKKSISIKNHICDNYLKYMNLGQFTDEPNAYLYNRAKYLDRVYIKFDTPIINPETSTKTDYDVYMNATDFKFNGNSNSCTDNYLYQSEASFKNTGDDTDEDINNYIGKQIATLAFCNQNSTEISAYIDTSGFDLKIIQDETLFIKRVDEFTTNMECIGLDYPIHIGAPLGRCAVFDPIEFRFWNYHIDAFLYSVGFGTKKGKMNYEYKLDDNEIDIIKTDTTFSFALKTGDKITLYPHSSLMPSSSKYPLRMYSPQELHPSNNLYSGSNKYPLKSNFKYIIFKYRLYKTRDDDVIQDAMIPMDEFYTMNLESDYIGVFEVRSKIERRT